MKLAYSSGPRAGQQVNEGDTLEDGVTQIIMIQQQPPYGNGKVQYQRADENGAISGLEVPPEDLGLLWE